MLFKCLCADKVGKRRGIIDFVIPTVGRPTLQPLVASLSRGATGHDRVIVVDDRRTGAALDLQGAVVVRAGAGGPAAARNRGWRAGRGEWVVFLDDDVVLTSGWRAELSADLADAGPHVGAVFGRVHVPLPAGRRPTDRERNVAGLSSAHWVTADAAYRRTALEAVGGFDERFTRAYREDADLALRVMGAGWKLVNGRRAVVHPVRPAPWWVSVALQRGNADDVLMRALHGRGWRDRAGAPHGRLPAHVALTAIAAGAAVAAASGSRRVARAAAAAWALGTAEFAARRIAPGPRTVGEVGAMTATSAVLPAVAVANVVRGWLRLPGQLRAGGPAPGRARPADDGGPGGGRPAAPGASRPPAAVLFDRDGTLIQDVPYNGDPDRVVPMPGAAEALARLRRLGVPTAVISNQSGIGRGYLTWQQVEAVNRRVEDLLGHLGPWEVCPHAPEDGCACRKPAPGLVERAAARLRVQPEDVAVIGDIGADVEAAEACGATAVLVPTMRTRVEEHARARHVAASLPAALDLLLGAEQDR